MKLKNLSKLVFGAFFGLAIVGFSNVDASAQGNGRWAQERNRARKVQRQHAKAQRQAVKQYYRVYRANTNSYYQTDYRGAELLRQAVNQGYRQGYTVGRNEANYRRSNNYRDDQYYRTGTYGYQTYVSRDQYQYYFRQGYQRGYNDGYSNQARYGYQSGGSMNILGSILGTILNIRQF